MTTSLHGADIAALRATAQQMCDAAQELIISDLRVATALASLTWNGQDAMRARQDWDGIYAPAIYTAARALVGAGEQVMAHADDQEQTSAAGGSATAPSAQTQATGAQLGALSGVLARVTPSEQTMGAIRKAVSLVGTVQDLNTLAKVVKVPGLIGAALDSASVASDLGQISQSAQDGDYHGALNGSVGIGAVGLGTVSPAHGAAVGVSWKLGTFIGDAFNAGIEGTRYEQNMQEMFDETFDRMGAFGMVMTPAVLGSAAVLTGVQTVGDWFRGDEQTTIGPNPKTAD